MHLLGKDGELGTEYKMLHMKQEQLDFLIEHGKKAKIGFGPVRIEKKD
jgi:hypothetical protein